MATDKVYIPNSSGHNYSDAERFGELVVLSTGTIDKFNITAMHRLFSPFLQASSPTDWIIQTGPSITLSIVSAMFAARHQCLNLLIWRVEEDGKDHYVHHRLVL